MKTTLFDLFLTFFKIGSFTIGGGGVMIPIIEREIVDKRALISKDEFVDIIVLSQTAPGVMTVNIAMMIGSKVGGWKAALLCVFATLLPSIVIILALAYFLEDLQQNLYFKAAFKALNPAVIGLLACAIISLAKNVNFNKFTILIPLVTVLFVWLLDVSPIYIVMLAIVSGIVIDGFLSPRFKKRKK